MPADLEIPVTPFIPPLALSRIRTGSREVNPTPGENSTFPRRSREAGFGLGKILVAGAIPARVLSQSDSNMTGHPCALND
jgi:hypothetical protein